MADKSLFPSGVEVHSRTLTYESDARIEDLKQLTVDATSTGVEEGLEVTVNGGDNTKIDVAVGSAYAPNGEYMTLSSAQTGLTVPLNTPNTLNYVLLIYDETDSLPESHETDGTTQNTRRNVTPRVVVLNPTDYAALPATDSVMSNNALDRAALLAVITGSGGALTSSNIGPPTTFFNVLQISQPISITGITVIDVDPNTTPGTGTLAFTPGPPGSATWSAPGDTPGASMPFPSSGTYILTSTGGETLTVNVTVSLLPIGAASDSIAVTNVYGQDVPRFTAEDKLHRSMTGSGIATTTNPHGMTLDDLSPGAAGSLEGHQDVMHANGILRTSNANLFTATVNTGGAPDQVTVTNFTTGDAVYINGKRIEDLDSSNIVTFTDGTVEPATYLIYVNQDSIIQKQQIARFPVVATALLEDKIQILDVVGMTAPGPYNLTWTTAGTIQWDVGPAITAPSVDHIIRAYSANRVGYVDLWVKGGVAAPGVNETDSITLTALPADEENIPLATVAWAGSALGFVGFGFGASNTPNFAFDKRLFGTLDESNTRLDAGMIDTAQFIEEDLGTGIIVRSRTQPGTTINEFTVADAFSEAASVAAFAFPNVNIVGFAAYVGGRRFEIPSDNHVLTDNMTNRAYVDSEGQIQISTDSWVDIIAAQHGKPILRLYDFVVAAGVLNPSYATGGNLRTYIGHKRNQPMGVVALNQDSQASITSTAGDALTVTGVGHGVVGTGGTAPGFQGGRFTGSGANNAGVVGIGVGTGSGLAGTGGAAGNGVTGTATGTSAFNNGVYGLGNNPTTVAIQGGTGVAGVGGENVGVIASGTGAMGGTGAVGFGGNGQDGTGTSVGGVGGVGGDFRGGEGGIGGASNGSGGYGVYIIGGYGPVASSGVGGYGAYIQGGNGGGVGNNVGGEGVRMVGGNASGTQVGGSAVWGTGGNGGGRPGRGALFEAGAAISTVIGNTGVIGIGTGNVGFDFGYGVYGRNNSAGTDGIGVKGEGIGAGVEARPMTFSTTGVGLRVNGGNIEYTNNQTISAAQGYANTLTHKNVCKAWAKFTITWGGAFSANSIVIDGGFNMTQSAGDQLTNSNRAFLRMVTGTGDPGGCIAIAQLSQAIGAPSDIWSCKPLVTNIAGPITQIQINSCYHYDPGALTQPTLGDTWVMFVEVYGPQ